MEGIGRLTAVVHLTKFKKNCYAKNSVWIR